MTPAFFRFPTSLFVIRRFPLVSRPVFLARSRKTRDNIKEKIEWAGLIAEDSESIHGIEGAAADFHRAANVLYGVTAARGTLPIALALKEKGCDLLVAPAGSTFITNDDPALVYFKGKLETLKLNSDFIESSDTDVFMVLRPDIACLWGITSTQQVREVPPACDNRPRAFVPRIGQLHRISSLPANIWKSFFRSRNEMVDVALHDGIAYRGRRYSFECK